ncbi:FG-GAP repeat domain-containing protein [Streptomyces sp. SDr-06]|uniref:FG-GAP repeat domain-containing protein n=1 Tax=Streptomyces sp. SDr-06 TaxID=2267702 RepID=UPI001CB97A3F|nr:VCBS repeat-containing protein [Streptomyces sp. SDr-06]
MRTKRASRLAACTAIVLSAGMLLAGPASADTHPAGPHVAVEPAKPATQPTAQFPKRKSAYATTSAVPSKPRFDLDHDGRSDLLVREPNDTLTLETGKNVPNPTVPNSYGTFKDLIEPGDLDGDGNPELLVLSPTGTLSLFTGLSATHFTDSAGKDQLSVNSGSLSWSSNGWNAYNKLFSPGDVTGDGKTDLMARTPSGDLYLYPGTGSVSGSPYGDRIKIGTGWGIYDQVVGASDMDGDGIADVVARTPGGDLYFYPGSGNAAAPLKDRVKIGTGWGIYNQILSQDDTTGYADIIARDAAGTFWFYAPTGKGGLSDRSQMGTGWSAVTLANTGGNPAFGKADLMALDTQGSLYYYWAKGNGTMADRQLLSDVGGWAGADISFASSLRSDSRWGTLLELGGGHLYVAGHDMGAGWDAFNGIAGVGDLTGEGNGDLLARGNNGHMYLYPGNGQATGFYNRVDLGAGWNGFNKLIGAGDVNGDGIADLLARDDNGHLFLYPGKSTPGFGNRIDLGGGWNGYNKLATPGDMTGDGRTDLIGVDASGTAWRYDANGTGSFKERVNLGGGWNTYNGIY